MAALSPARPVEAARPEVGKVWTTTFGSRMLVEKVEERTSLTGPSYTVITGTRVDDRPSR